MNSVNSYCHIFDNITSLHAVYAVCCNCSRHGKRLNSHLFAKTLFAQVWCISFLLVQLSAWMVLTGASQRQTRDSEGAVVGESVFRNLQTGAGGNLRPPQGLGFGSNQDPGLGNLGGFSRDQLLSQLFGTPQQQGLTTTYL